MTARRNRGWVPVTVLLVVVTLICGCLGALQAFKSDMDAPPELTAAYTSGEALLVMEDLAGDLIAALPADADGPLFHGRLWETRTCASGWNDHIAWDGFVSVMVAYRFDQYTADAQDQARRRAYSEQVAAAIEAMGMDPAVERSDNSDEITVRAERDDGLQVIYASRTGLRITTGCVVDDGQWVYTPPHDTIPPTGDIQDLQGW